MSPQCEAHQLGREVELPIKLKRKVNLEIAETLLIIERRDLLLLWQRPDNSSRMAGFWELPEAGRLTTAKVGRQIGVVRHTITHHNYTFRVCRASVGRAPVGYQWISRGVLPAMPASTVLRKALSLALPVTISIFNIS